VSAYLLLTATAFASQALLFVPIVPLLLASGALASRGQLQLSAAVVALVTGLASGDYLWFRLGRRGGNRVLERICRLANEPASCVRRSENLFGRYGARGLVVAKFVPGVSTVALPLAGVFRMRPRRFVLFDSIGVLLWSGAYVALGYVSGRGLMSIGAAPPHIPRLAWITALVVGSGTFIAWRYLARQRMLRALRIDRIEPDDLHRKLEAHEPVIVVDLRHPIDYEGDPYMVPGALYIPAEELASHRHRIPADREVVLYCTCPDEVTSAREALRLRKQGIRRVRPLHGGLSAWRARGFPVELSRPVARDDERILNAA
jgi:membrane protein DedA with SNARE-associated domain/rhodanese-related sulfurtransferase